jgi:hypothetical protein
VQGCCTRGISCFDIRPLRKEGKHEVTLAHGRGIVQSCLPLPWTLSLQCLHRIDKHSDDLSG